MTNDVANLYLTPLQTCKDIFYPPRTFHPGGRENIRLFRAVSIFSNAVSKSHESYFTSITWAKIIINSNGPKCLQSAQNIFVFICDGVNCYYGTFSACHTLYLHHFIEPSQQPLWEKHIIFILHLRKPIAVPEHTGTTLEVRFFLFFCCC